jgi:hypothetical protein
LHVVQPLSRLTRLSISTSGCLHSRQSSIQALQCVRPPQERRPLLHVQYGRWIGLLNPNPNCLS